MQGDQVDRERHTERIGQAHDGCDALSFFRQWEATVFGEGGRAPLMLPTPPRAPVHGDLNGLNVLVDGYGRTWVIDLAHFGPGHALRDLAKLEATLLLEYTPLCAADAAPNPSVASPEVSLAASAR